MKRIVITVQENKPYQFYKNFDDDIEVLVETTYCDSVSVEDAGTFIERPERNDGMVKSYFDDAERAGHGD